MCKKRHSYMILKIVNNRNKKQVRNKKKLLGKLYLCQLGSILQFWLMSKVEHYYERKEQYKSFLINMYWCINIIIPSKQRRVASAYLFFLENDDIFDKIKNTNRNIFADNLINLNYVWTYQTGSSHLIVPKNKQIKIIL